MGDRDGAATPTDYKVRRAAAGDLDRIRHLYRQLNPGDPVPTDGSDAAAFEQILKADGLTLFVLELDGTVVATTYLNVIPNLTRSASPYGVIENVVVEESLRGKGLGQQIMAATMKAAWDAGCYKVMLLSGSSNPATHGFYRACGFSSDYKTGFSARRSIE